MNFFNDDTIMIGISMDIRGDSKTRTPFRNFVVFLIQPKKLAVNCIPFIHPSTFTNPRNQRIQGANFRADPAREQHSNDLNRRVKFFGIQTRLDQQIEDEGSGPGVSVGFNEGFEEVQRPRVETTIFLVVLVGSANCGSDEVVSV